MRRGTSRGEAIVDILTDMEVTRYCRRKDIRLGLQGVVAIRSPRVDVAVKYWELVIEADSLTPRLIAERALNFRYHTRTATVASSAQRNLLLPSADLAAATGSATYSCQST